MATFNITDDGNTLVQINRGHTFSVAVSGTLDGTITAQYATSEPVAASLTTSLSGANNDVTFTAKNAGTDGNSLTVAYTDPGESESELSFTFDGTDLVISLATGAGNAASVTTAMTGTNNDITVTADTSGQIGNTYSFELIDPSANDQTLVISSVDFKKFTATLATGSGGAITTTATQLVAALNAYAPFAALMTASVKSGDNGSGVVTALSETDLTGGGASYAITTTGQDIVDLVAANPTIYGHITAANAATNTGAGVVTALSETALSGGTDGDFASYASGDGGEFAAADERVFVNCGATDKIRFVTADTTTTNATLIVTDLGKY